MEIHALLQSCYFLHMGCGGIADYCLWRMVRIPQMASAICKAYEQSSLFPEVEALHCVRLGDAIEIILWLVAPLQTTPRLTHSTGARDRNSFIRIFCGVA